MVDRHSLPKGFTIYQKLDLDTGIYECEPTGFHTLKHNYPFWIIASLDLNLLNLKKNDSVDVDFDLDYKQENHYIAMANGRPIIAIPATRIDIESEDEYESFGVPVPRTESISEEEKASVVTRVKELVRHVKKRFNTPRRGHGTRQYYTNKIPRRGHGTRQSDQSDQSPSPKRKKLFSNSTIPPTIPPTIPHFKKNKKSSRKSLNKSKTSIKCKKTPYAWKSSSIKKSPFRTLKEAKDVEARYKAGQPIGFTAISSLKSQGRIPRSDGCYVLGDKYSALKRR